VPDGWEERARERFLDGYFARVDPSVLPPGKDATDRLLTVFELEKAVYELRYELNHRPDWVRIPVAGIVRLLNA
jgi:maltokinase